MAANIDDLITKATNGTRPEPTTLTNSRNPSDNSISVDSLTGWPTDTAVHFIIYRKDAAGKKLAGTQTDWKGIASGTTISDLELMAGTDNGDPIGAVVEAGPTAMWANGVYDAFTAEHDKLTGGHKDITSTSVTSDLVTTDETDTDTINEKTTNSGVTVDGVLIKDGKIQTTALSNPYKFSVYRSAAFTAGVPTTVIFDTKIFDTGSNYSTSTGLFTAPVNGFYRFGGRVGVSVASGAGLLIYLMKNGSGAKLGTSQISAVGSWNWGLIVTGLLQLTAGDTVNIAIYGSSNPAEVGESATWFDGELVSTT